ncbi:MAG: serine/threonine-protein kinase [Polyangiales bacterium]
MQPARELKSLGKYRLIASLGRGGMARVYLALMAGPAGFSKLLVIKVLRDDPDAVLSGVSDRLQMFWEEARLAARLSHPNIVQTHEVGESNGRYFIAMEYLDGQSYSALLTHVLRDTIPRAEHLRIVAEVARALHYSHTLRSYQGESIGVVHRDISPHNVVLTYDGQVKLVDFGVATTEDPEHVTRVGVIKGKLDYIAPEQLRGEPIDGRADVFALGAVLWEALCDQRFAGGRKVADASKVQARLTGAERKLAEIDPTLPRDLVEIVERAIALEPDQRYPDAAAFADAIEAYLASIEERPSAKTLSAVISPMFEAQRAQLHESINAQLQLLKQRPLELGDTTGSLPHIAHPQHEEGSSRDVQDVIDAPQPSSSAIRSGVPRAALPSLVGERPLTRYLQTAALIACMMTLGALIGLLWPARESEPVAKAPLPAIPQPAATPAPPPVREPPPRTAPRTVQRPETVLLQISVSPASARLTLDGAQVATPYATQHRKDNNNHAVEVSADGFRTLRRNVRLERDQTLVLALERVHESSRRASAPSRRESASDRRDPPSSEEAPAPPASPERPAHAQDAHAPGTDLPVPSSGALADDLYQTNPYRN